MWFKLFGQELDPELKQKIEIKYDNQSALTLANTDCFRGRSKHIDVRHQYLREKIIDMTVSISYTALLERFQDQKSNSIIPAWVSLKVNYIKLKFLNGLTKD